MALEQNEPEVHTLQQTIIHLTDGMPSLVPLVADNIALNGLSSLVASEPTVLFPSLLPWGEPLDYPIPSKKQLDVILAADCAYFEPAFPALDKTINAAMGDETVLWFCYLRRRKRDAEMIKRLFRLGLDVKEMHTGELGLQHGRAGGDVRGGGGVVLYEIRRPSAGVDRRLKSCGTKV